MSARTARGTALVVLSFVVATSATASAASSTSTTTTTSPTSTSVRAAVALYPLDEFVGRWNEANGLIADQMSPSVHLPIDASALILRPINEQVSFFDWHFPAAGYVGGVVDNSTGDVYLAVVAGDPESALMRSAVGTLVFMLTADRPDDTALFSEAYGAFVADPQAGATEYVVAGPLGIAMQAFDGVEPDAPWVAVAAASPTDEERALLEAAVLAGLVAGTAVPPAPAPEHPGAATATTEAAAGVAAAGPSLAATTTSPAAATTVTSAAAPPTTSVAVAPPAPLHPSIGSFVAEWNVVAEQVSAIHPDVAAPVVEESAFVRQPVPSDGAVAGSELFATRLGTNAFVGGALDETGAVIAVVVGGDPDSTTTAAAVVVPFVLEGQPEDSLRLSQTYSELVTGTDDVNAEYVISGSNGFSFLIVPGSQPDDPWVSVTAAPAVDPATAFVASYELTLAVGSLALSAPVASAPSTVLSSPSSTAPIAALPTTVVPAAPSTVVPVAPTSTLLPTVSIAPPGVTAAPTTTTPGPPPTTAAAVAGALFASIDDLVARWNEKATAASLSGVDISITADEIVLVSTGAPQDVFAGWIDQTSYLGGAADPTTENISSLAVVVLPSSPTAVDVLFNTVDLVSPDAFAEFMTAYTSVLNSAPGTNVYLPAEPNDLVFSVLEPAAGGEHLVAVTAAPRTDETTAVANAAWLNETLPHTLSMIE